MGFKKIIIWIMSVIIVATLISIFIIPKIIAQETQPPQDIEDYKKAVEKANSGFWDWLFARQSIAGTGNWEDCGSYLLPFSTSECNPCSGDEVASNCFYGCYNSGSPYSIACCYSMHSCSDWLCCGSMNVIKTCYCTIPQPECSGGASPGDKKCSSGEVWRCNSNGVWEMDEDCDYTCENSRCTGECSGDSDCGIDDYTGNKFCKNNNVFQSYRDYDCSDHSCSSREEDRLIDDCTSSESCLNGECISSCQPKTCSQLNFACGLQDDSCGNAIECGSCNTGYSCINGICTPGSCTPDCDGKECGVDGCGGSCGTCDNGETCDEGVCTSEDTEGIGSLFQIAIGIIIVFMLGIVGFAIYKWRK